MHMLACGELACRLAHVFILSSCSGVCKYAFVSCYWPIIACDILTKNLLEYSWDNLILLKEYP